MKDRIANIVAAVGFLVVVGCLLSIGFSLQDEETKSSAAVKHARKDDNSFSFVFVSPLP